MSRWDNLIGKRTNEGKEGCLRSDICILKSCNVDMLNVLERITVGIKRYICE